MQRYHLFGSRSFIESRDGVVKNSDICGLTEVKKFVCRCLQLRSHDFLRYLAFTERMLALQSSVSCPSFL